MHDLTGVLKLLREECGEDYVGLWVVHRLLTEHIADLDSPIDATLSVVAEVLSDGSIQIGQFQNGRFVRWSGTTDETLKELRSQLVALGRAPDIGEIAWLASRE